ncbi:hypothetical protein CR513_09567, partial [Mucuna pruriens]
MEAPLPKGWRGVYLDKYDGTSDLEKHLAKVCHSDVSIKIYNLNLEVALNSIFMALKAGPFFDSLCRDPPTNINELRMRAISYI